MRLMVLLVTEGDSETVVVKSHVCEYDLLNVDPFLDMV